MSNRESGKTSVLGMLTALIVVLQFMGTFIKFGSFSITLTLVPIVIGGALYGAKAGAFLGAVFGIVTSVMCAVGLDAGGQMLFAVSPVLTVLVCMVKATAAGAVAGAVAKSFKTHTTVGVISAAVCAPVVNTGLFILAMLFLFKDTLTLWASGSNIFVYVITGLTGINFLIELLINVILAPSTVRIVRAVKSVKTPQ